MAYPDEKTITVTEFLALPLAVQGYLVDLQIAGCNQCDINWIGQYAVQLIPQIGLQRFFSFVNTSADFGTYTTPIIVIDVLRERYDTDQDYIEY